jgi:hypothetical protein
VVSCDTVSAITYLTTSANTSGFSLAVRSPSYYGAQSEIWYAKFIAPATNPVVSWTAPWYSTCNFTQVTGANTLSTTASATGYSTTPGATTDSTGYANEVSVDIMGTTNNEYLQNYDVTQPSGFTFGGHRGAYYSLDMDLNSVVSYQTSSTIGARGGAWSAKVNGGALYWTAAIAFSDKNILLNVQG